MIRPGSDKNGPVLQGKLQKMLKDLTICFKKSNPTKFAKFDPIRQFTKNCIHHNISQINDLLQQFASLW